MFEASIWNTKIDKSGERVTAKALRKIAEQTCAVPLTISFITTIGHADSFEAIELGGEVDLRCKLHPRDEDKFRELLGTDVVPTVGYRVTKDTRGIPSLLAVGLVSNKHSVIPDTWVKDVPPVIGPSIEG
jgi:hypothetical protein